MRDELALVGLELEVGTREAPVGAISVPVVAVVAAIYSTVASSSVALVTVASVAPLTTTTHVAGARPRVAKWQSALIAVLASMP